MSEIAETYKILSLCFHNLNEELLASLREADPFRNSLKGVSLTDLKREHTRLFSLSVAGGIPPYETEYGIKNVFMKTQQMADISGFYRAFGMEMSDSAHQRLDFIGAELELMCWLTLKEERAREKALKKEAEICRDAAQKFMSDHLGRWAPFFGEEIAKASQLPFYRRLGQNLSTFVVAECRRLGVEPKKLSGRTPEGPPAEFSCKF